MKYTLFHRAQTYNTIKAIASYDTKEEAIAELKRFFLIDVDASDIRREYLLGNANIKFKVGEKILTPDEFDSIEGVDDYEYIFPEDFDRYEYDQHYYYVEEEATTFHAIVDGVMIAEYNDVSDQFAEQKCYDAIKRYMSELDSSAYPIDTWIEADANEVDGSRALWSYDFDKDEWIIE